MLEEDDCLLTWRIDVPPRNWVFSSIKAEKIFDHDKKYLTYQGPVNKGAGKVEIADTGELKITCKKQDRVEFTSAGKILNGSFTLFHSQNNKWELSLLGSGIDHGAE